MSASPPKPASPPLRTPSKTSDRLAAAETVARFVAEGVSGSGVKGLEGPARTMSGIISHIKRVADNSAACKDVIEQIDSLSNVLKDATDSINVRLQAHPVPAAQVKCELESSKEMGKRIQRLQERLDAIDAVAAKIRRQSLIRRTVLANGNADTLRGISDGLRQARDDFMLISQLAIEIVLRNVAAEVKANTERKEKETAAKAARQKAADLDAALDKLPYVEAGYLASVHARHGRLLAGTREAVLSDIGDWFECKTQALRDCPFFILSGGAGTGKSTIAFEVARCAEATNRLGASFFFTRGSALLSSTESFFPTIARQLVINVPACRDNAVLAILGHIKHGARQNLDRQVNDLFIGLLSKVPHDHPPIVIVIDAVDECDNSTQDLVCRMLFLMMSALADVTCPVRVFVTSRPEVHIEDAFTSPLFSKAQRFVLSTIPRSIIDTDIRSYFLDALPRLCGRGHERLLALYPDAVEDLTELSAGLFISATTAIEFLRQFGSAVPRGMEQLLATGMGTALPPLESLDRLYTMVLSTAFPCQFPVALRQSMRDILGCIAVLQEQISPHDLSVITGRSLEDEILPVIERLGAVLSYERTNLHAPMRPLHASFGEFLVDPNRCTDPAFYVESKQQHGALAIKCLSVLLRPGVLLRNICRLPDPTVLVRTLDDLNSRIEKHIPIPVRYCCSHWLLHVALSQGCPSIEPWLTDFCVRSPRLLEWLEVLAFLDNIERAIVWLPKVYSIYNLHKGAESPGALLYDVYRISAGFSPALRACPEQLLVKAPVIHCGTSSARWPAWVRTEPSGRYGLVTSRVYDFAYNGKWVAVFGNGDGTIHLCRPDSGDVVLTVRSHSSPVKCVRFSRNGLRMVSASAGHIFIHSTRSGTVLHYLSLPGRAPPLLPFAFFALEDNAILFLNWTFGIWQPMSGNVTMLEFIPASAANELRDVSSDGHWAIVVCPELSSDAQLILDIGAQSLRRTLWASALISCFVPGSHSVIIDKNDRLIAFDIITGDVSRDLGPFSPATHRRHVVASQNAQTVALGSVQQVLCYTDGQRITISNGDVLTQVAVSPDGGRILAMLLSANAWKTIHVSKYEPGDSLVSPAVPHPKLRLPNNSRTTVEFSIGISGDLSTIAVATGKQLTLYDAKLRCIDTITDVAGNGGHPQFSPGCRGTVVSYDGSLIASWPRRCGSMVPDRILMYDRNSRQSRLLSLPIKAPCFYPRPTNIRSLRDVRVSCATFTADNAQLLAIIYSTVADPDRPPYDGAVYLASWDLIRDSCQLSRVNGLEITVVAVVGNVSNDAFIISSAATETTGNPFRAYITSDNSFHFAVRGQNTGNRITTYTIQLPDRGAPFPDSIVASVTGGFPEEWARYTVTADGWISRTSTQRQLCWIPSTYRPDEARIHAASDTCKHLIATVAKHGEVMVVDMSRYDIVRNASPSRTFAATSFTNIA